jgi:hypothetical protein
MSDENKSFGRTAEKLARNPLGIIALFIVLAHAFASLILAFSNRLQSGQQWPLIIFVVLFPIIVLSIFTHLVIKHHTKLYSPGDYRSDESFLKSVSPEQLKSKLKDDVSLSGDFVIGDKAVISLKTIEDESSRMEKTLPSTSEENAKNGNERKISQKAMHNQEGFLAEDLALRKLEASFNQPVRRQSIIYTNKISIRFDGVITQNDLVTGIEVFFLRRGQFIPTEKIDKCIIDTVTAENYLSSLGKRFSFIFVIILDDIDSEDASENNIKRFIMTRVTSLIRSITNVKVQVYNFKELKEEFGYQISEMN